ncbi:MAG: hypothetical protein BZY82_08210 [SAR202 cluster bacterium Io17-Chloro-G3]|nr:MAG: hypothetical protein BZY82_08210 [SAR202 cluster bacterium Io17-Chloro-G3]
MIRHLSIKDAFKLFALRGSERIVHQSNLAKGKTRVSSESENELPGFSLSTFLRGHLSGHRKDEVWVSVDQGNITGLTTARCRRGPTSWAVQELVVLPGAEERCGDLLEVAANFAEEQGAERIFVRVPDVWRLLELTRRSGFLPCVRVLTLALIGRAALLGAPSVQSYHDRCENDTEHLFRIYCETTPAKARLGMGLTLQQWLDSQESSRRDVRELVVKHDQKPVAWLRLENRREYMEVQAMIDPRWTSGSQALVLLVLKLAGRKPVLWEVPAYQESLHLTLDQVGFQVSSSCQLMVKPLAVRITEPFTMPATV